MNYLDYDFPSEKKNDTEKDSNKNEPIFKNTTVLLAPEIKYMYDNVGLKLQYGYTPYELNAGFESGFGSSSISFGIIYRQ